MSSTLNVVQGSLNTDGDAMTVHAGSFPSWAFSLADLLAEDGRWLDVQQRQWFVNEPWSPPERFSAFVGSVARMTLTPTLAALRHHRQVPTVGFDGLHFDLHQASSGQLDVWWPDQVTLTEVDDLEAALDTLIAQMIGFMTPLITAMGPRVRVGPHKLWAQVVDAFTGCRPRYSDPAPEADRAFWAAFRAGARGTVLDQSVEVLDVGYRKESRQMVRATACCFVYQQPPAPGVRCYPWSSSRWAGYCLVCPIIPAQDSIARASYLLNACES